MEAVAQEEVTTTTATTSKLDQTTLIVKGKRTKRQRPQSPMPFSVAAAAETGDEKYNSSRSPSPSPSPVTSGENNAEPDMVSTEEEEDMAKCLILLAQGHSRWLATAAASPKHHPPLPPQPPANAPPEDGASAYKFSSRKFLKAAAAPADKGGYYVYECKTCNRTFPSFQALGGHRASHKKTKAIAAMEDNTSSKNKLNHGFLGLANSDEEDHHHNHHQNLNNQSQALKLINSNSTVSSTSLSLQLSNRNVYETSPVNNKSSSKVHECSICGAEFTSGQALGGHMRRHRATLVGPAASAAAVTAPAVTALSLSTNVIAATPLMVLEPDISHDHRDDDEDDDDDQRHSKRARTHVLSLDLDLNLPAPEDDHRESKFSAVSNKQQQQSSLVFSAPALVDCHY